MACEYQPQNERGMAETAGRAPARPGGAVQRYVADGGAKASRGGELFLAAPRESFADKYGQHCQGGAAAPAGE